MSRHKLSEQERKRRQFIQLLKTLHKLQDTFTKESGSCSHVVCKNCPIGLPTCNVLNNIPQTSVYMNRESLEALQYVVG